MPTMRFDLPTPEADTAEFWEGTRHDKLLIKRCKDCERAHYYPRTFCPYCWSTNVQWEESSGEATLYTWSVVYQNDLPPFNERVPYVAAVVDLKEGPRMMTNIVGSNPAELRIGMDLRVCFEPVSEDFTLPLFQVVPPPRDD